MRLNTPLMATPAKSSLLPTPDAVQHLETRGLRKTPGRLAVLAILESTHGVLSIQNIYDALKKKLRGKRPDWATIFRTVTQFEETGIIDSCELGDGVKRYELKHHEHGHHHHIICTECGRVEHLDLCTQDVLHAIAARSGFSDIHHKLEFQGTCPRCAHTP